MIYFTNELVFSRLTLLNYLSENSYLNFLSLSHKCWSVEQKIIFREMISINLKNNDSKRLYYLSDKNSLIAVLVGKKQLIKSTVCSSQLKPLSANPIKQSSAQVLSNGNCIKLNLSMCSFISLLLKRYFSSIKENFYSYGSNATWTLWVEPSCAKIFDWEAYSEPSQISTAFSH